MVPAIYETLKEYNGKIESLPYSMTRLDDVDGIAEQMRLIEQRIPNRVREILAAVVDRYRRLSGPELHRLTHVKGTPWEDAYRRGEQHVRIPDHSIQRYYEALNKQGA